MKSRSQNLSIFTTIIVVTAGCLIYGIMQGIHDNYGIMMKSLVPATGVKYADISFIIGVGAFLYGLVQPFFGMLALKKSNAFVMILGIAMIVAGLVVTPLCRNFWTMLPFFGIILPAGTGALSFGIVMSALTPILGEKKAAAVSGIVQASAGVGDALMSPALQSLISWRGIFFSMTSFAVMMACTLPVVIWIGVKNKNTQNCAHPDTMETDSKTSTAKSEIQNVSDAENLSSSAKSEQNETLFSIIKTAFKNPVYRKIFIGFSTCGFNMSIIESHLFSQYVSWGIPETAASLVMTVYGVLTMLGAMGTGFLSTKFKMKNVLGSVYAIRVVISLSMLIAPHNMAYALIATGLLGMTGDSTVPPTTGLITREFGAKRLAVIYGTALIGHQVGAFLSSWFGGICVESFGSYVPLWCANAALCALAALASYSIREKK